MNTLPTQYLISPEQARLRHREVTGYILYHAYMGAMCFPALGMVPDPMSPEAWERWGDRSTWDDAARRLNEALGLANALPVMTDAAWVKWYGRAPLPDPRPWWKFW